MIFSFPQTIFVHLENFTLFWIFDPQNAKKQNFGFLWNFSDFQFFLSKKDKNHEF